MVFKAVPTVRLEIPKSEIFNHIGVIDAIRMFYQAIMGQSAVHAGAERASLVASNRDGRFPFRAARQGLLGYVPQSFALPPSPGSGTP